MTARSGRVGATAAAVVLFTCVVLAGACGGGPSRGDALAEAGLGFGARGVSALVVGHEYALLFIPAANRSDEPVTLERVDVRGISGERAAELVGVDVELREERDGDYVGGGMIEIVEEPRRDCRDTRAFVPLEGHVVEPGDDPLLAVRIRANAPGAFRTKSLRVFYRQDGEHLYQDMGFRMRLRVRRTPLPWPKDEAPRPCALLLARADAP
jgi:hypothetical protein